MNKIDALKALRDQIARGEWRRSIDVPSDETGLRSFVAYFDRVMTSGSLDPLQHMHNYLLSNCTWKLESFGGHAYCIIQNPNSDREFWSKKQPTPARAWMVAILEALIAREQA